MHEDVDSPANMEQKDHEDLTEEEKKEEARIEHIRRTEYPSLKDEIYFDHAGTPPIPKSLLERFTADLTSNLYGNPHSNSTSSQLATKKIENIRLEVLRFFNADPDKFDLVFVANATAGIKLVADALRDSPGGYWYGYHVDAHTSLVGVRETATQTRCFRSDEEVENWLEEINDKIGGGELDGDGELPTSVLFAYPAQSNMNGRRLPLKWTSLLRQSNETNSRKHYSLLDAAAYVSTTPLDLSNADAAPDFTVCSFYKIFGFPDLGGLIVRKDSARIVQSRRYFGGGTVDMVVTLKESWHARKSESVHASLEDGTLPVHNIIALGHAVELHRELFRSHARISQRTTALANLLYTKLSSLQHLDGTRLCVIYNAYSPKYANRSVQGPVIAFNMRNADGSWILNSEVEKLAAIKGIHLRAGGLCNPGGLANSLGLEPWEMKKNFSAGYRCGDEADVTCGKPTGMLRVSLGAISTVSEIQTFVEFLKEFFTQGEGPRNCTRPSSLSANHAKSNDFYVESLTIYPIKSCGGWRVPRKQAWEIRREGLAWDREWCLMHQGTGKAMNQKSHPRMALIRPSIDLDRGVLRVGFESRQVNWPVALEEVVVPLSGDPNYFEDDAQSESSSSVCGEMFKASAYRSPQISEFFSSALGVPCRLARVSVMSSRRSLRHAKAEMQSHQLDGNFSTAKGDTTSSIARPILLSNESPILVISRSSLNRLNEEIKERGGKAAQAEVFRANIVIAQEFGRSCGMEQPYIEDYWRVIAIGSQHFQVLGSCRRCQMVCIDQNNAEKNAEPFVTLSKTRRFDGKVWFGQHLCHLPNVSKSLAASQHPTIEAGASVKALFDGKYSQSLLKEAGVIA